MALSESREGLAGVSASKASRFRLSSITPASRYYWIRVLLENKAAAVSLMFIFVLALVTIFAGVFATHDPNFVNPADRLASPGSDYRFGTDTLGRDLYSRVLHGARISLLVGGLVMFGAGFFGTVFGLIAGFYDRLDTPMMRVMDGFEAFPGILLAIAIMASLGAATENVIIALIVVFTPNVARLVRGTTLVTKRALYVESAKAIGMKDAAILRKYVFMNSLSPLIVQCTFVVAFAVLAEASLSFLGAGVPPGTPTWGNMVSEGQAYLNRAWWISIFPGAMLFLTVMAINLVGDGLRDALDPRSRRR